MLSYGLLPTQIRVPLDCTLATSIFFSRFDAHMVYMVMIIMRSVICLNDVVSVALQRRNEMIVPEVIDLPVGLLQLCSSYIMIVK